MWRRSTPRKILNFASVKLQKQFRRDTVRGLPYRYKLDPTNHCHLKCPLCPTGLQISTRKTGRMDDELFRSIVDQIASHTLILDLFGWGEPLLHPRLNSLIRLAADRNIFTRLSTSLSLPEWLGAKQLVASGLDAVIVAVDGANQSSYERYRRNGRLDNVATNLRRLVEARYASGKSTPHITVRMLIHRFNEHELDEVKRLARQWGADAFTVETIVINSDDADQAATWLPTNTHFNSDQQNRGSCDDLWESMVINWDGGVSPCCWIYDPVHDLGSLKTSPLPELWNSPAYKAARRAVAHKKPADCAPDVLCTSCGGRPAYLVKPKPLS